jgi:hypothetical protein
MNPILGPRDLKKGPGIKLQIQWSVGETCRPSANELDLGVLLRF